MKITPDASLFQALSNFPKAGRETVNPALQQNRAAASNGARVSSATPSFEAARQAALRNNPDARPQAQSSAQAQSSTQSRSAATAGSLAQNGNRAASPYMREAPGVSEQKPNFVKLGQLIDISV